jgi:hypothetical protein
MARAGTRQDVKAWRLRECRAGRDAQKRRCREIYIVHGKSLSNSAVRGCDGQIRKRHSALLSTAMIDTGRCIQRRPQYQKLAIVARKSEFPC